MHIVENSNPVNFIAVFWNLKPLHKKFAWSAEDTRASWWCESGSSP